MSEGKRGCGERREGGRERVHRDCEWVSGGWRKEHLSEGRNTLDVSKRGSERTSTLRETE